MELRTNKSGEAAKQYKLSGPIFGDGDITIHKNAMHYTESNTALDRSYIFPTGLSLNSIERDTLLAGSKHFSVDEMEVFYYNGKIA